MLSDSDSDVSDIPPELPPRTPSRTLSNAVGTTSTNGETRSSRTVSVVSTDNNLTAFISDPWSNGIYSSNFSDCFLDLGPMRLSLCPLTRGSIYKIFQNHVNYNLCKYFFSNRVIQIWNSLPDSVVASGTINSFKNNLDKFWFNQEVKYNWKAELTGTGNCSLSCS